MIKKIRELPLNKRVFRYILILVGWLIVAYVINSGIEDPIEKSSNLRGLWILTGIIASILWAVFFPKKKIEE